jgi:hypothetical protein
MQLHLSPRLTHRLAAGAAVMVSTYAAILATGFLGIHTERVIGDCAELLASVLAAGASCLAARRTSGARRVAWALLGAYCSIWALSIGIWLAYDVSGATDQPFSTLAAIGFVASVPCAVAGSLAFSVRHGSRIPPLVRLLDAVTVALALMLICWVPVLEQVFDASGFRFGAQVMSLSIPVGDLLVVTMLWSAIASSTWRLRPSLVAVGIAFLCISAADFMLAYFSALGTFASGSLMDRVGLRWSSARGRVPTGAPRRSFHAGSRSGSRSLAQSLRRQLRSPTSTGAPASIR